MIWPEGVPIIGEAKTRLAVRERSQGRCEVCWKHRAQSCHHRRKKGQGGPWSFPNILHTCGDGTRGCHGRIEHEPAWARDYGYDLTNGEDPAEAPVLIYTPQGRGWWRLHPDGATELLDLAV